MRGKPVTGHKEPRMLLLVKSREDGTGGIKPDRKEMVVKAIAERACPERGKELSGRVTPTNSSFTGDNNPPSFKGPATMRQLCSSFSANFDWRQSSPFPDPVYLPWIPQRLYCRKGQAETVCAW